MFNIMKKTSLTTLTAIALAGAISTPAFAQQSNFNQRNQIRQDNNSDQLIGGAIGAVVGGVIGSEIAGRGNGTEGAIVGALIGGVSGAAIADNRRDRRLNDRRRFNRGLSSRQRFNRGFSGHDQFGFYDYYGYNSISKSGSFSRFGTSASIGNRGINNRRSFGRSSFGKKAFLKKRF